MNATTVSRMGAPRLIAAYLNDIRFEFLKMLRTPAFALPTLLFPAMFYLLFGVLLGAKAGPAAGLSTFARLGVFGTMAPGLFGFGVSLAFEREQGLLKFKQALPTPPGSYLLARMVMAMLFASIIAALLIVIALSIAHVPLTAGQVGRVFLIEVLGVLPFCALGLTVGAFISGQAAPALVNLIYLPMAFLSGLWVPLQFLPKIIQDMAPVWPAHHLAQLVLGALDQPTMGAAWTHVAALLGLTLLCFVIATRRLASSGLHLLGGGRRRPRWTPGVLVGPASIFVGIFLLIAGVVGDRSPTHPTNSAATPAEDSTAAAATATGPASADVAANTLAIADFDGGSATASFGEGWFPAGDDMRGGNSRASLRVVEGGAAGSPGALEVSGTIGDAIQYPFAGTAFFPAGAAPEALQDWSAHRTLRFFARGDGRSYTIVFLGTSAGGIPPMYGFVTAAEWREVSVPLSAVVNLDPAQVHGIVIGTMGPQGDFRFEIDGVELR